MEKIVHSAPQISISVVSHGQIHLVKDLLSDLDKYCHALTFEVILTLNLYEDLPFLAEDFSFPIRIIGNSKPLGFAANQNQAFTQATGEYFCVINPDIRLQSNPFPVLQTCLQDATMGVVAPLILNQQGELEDSARRFPTPLIIFCKALGYRKNNDYVISDQFVFPDWVGGMFMLFTRETFSTIGGFDERYFLYYEDVDICARLTVQGYKVCLSPKAEVIHHAQRTSHRNLQYLRWHITSMLRFFLSQPLRNIISNRLAKRISCCQNFMG